MSDTPCPTECLTRQYRKTLQKNGSRGDGRLILMCILMHNEYNFFPKKRCYLYGAHFPPIINHKTLGK